METRFPIIDSLYIDSLLIPLFRYHLCRLLKNSELARPAVPMKFNENYLIFYLTESLEREFPIIISILYTITMPN